MQEQQRPPTFQGIRILMQFTFQHKGSPSWNVRDSLQVNVCAPAPQLQLECARQPAGQQSKLRALNDCNVSVHELYNYSWSVRGSLHANNFSSEHLEGCTINTGFPMGRLVPKKGACKRARVNVCKCACARACEQQHGQVAQNAEGIPNQGYTTLRMPSPKAHERGLHGLQVRGAFDGDDGGVGA
eukprot:1152967-Pelagomonas_calceolata.AAC.1